MIERRCKQSIKRQDQAERVKRGGGGRGGRKLTSVGMFHKKSIGLKFVERFEGKSARSAQGETGEKADGEEEQRVRLMKKGKAGGNQVNQGTNTEGELVRGNKRHESAEVEGGTWHEVLVLLDEHGPAYTANERQRSQNSMVELHRRRILKHVSHPAQVQ